MTRPWFVSTPMRGYPGGDALSASMPNGKYLEYWHPAPYVSGILKHPLLLNADGMLPIPDGPGLGIEIDEAALKARGKNADSYS